MRLLLSLLRCCLPLCCVILLFDVGCGVNRLPAPTGSCDPAKRLPLVQADEWSKLDPAWACLVARREGGQQLTSQLVRITRKGLMLDATIDRSPRFDAPPGGQTFSFSLFVFATTLQGSNAMASICEGNMAKDGFQCGVSADCWFTLALSPSDAGGQCRYIGPVRAESFVEPDVIGESDAAPEPPTVDEPALPEPPSDVRMPDVHERQSEPEVGKEASTDKGLMAVLAASLGASVSAVGRAIVVDKKGHIFVAGSFKGVVSGTGCGASRKQDVFVAKFAPSGRLLWCQSGGSAEDDVATAMALDANGDVFIAGSIKGHATFGIVKALPDSSFGREIFVAKINANGIWLQSIWAGGVGDDVAQAITVGPRGGVYVAGEISQMAKIGDNKIDVGDTTHMFAAKLSVGGGAMMWDWSRSVSGGGYSKAYGIAVEASGFVHVVGEAKGKGMRFDTSQDVERTQTFIAKFAADGAWFPIKFIANEGPTGDNRGRGLAVDKGGNVVVTGSFTGKIGKGAMVIEASELSLFVGKLGARGSFRWFEKVTATSFDEGSAVTMDASGNVYVAGYASGDGDCGPGGKIINARGQQAFLGGLSADGIWQWCLLAGGSGEDRASGLALGPKGFLYVTGAFSKSALFDSMRLTSNGESDAFWWKRSASR